MGGVNTHGHRHEHKDLQVTPEMLEPVNEEVTASIIPNEEQKKTSNEAAYIAAQSVGVGVTTVRDIMRIAKVAPERIEDIKQGRSRGIPLLLSLD